MTVLGNVTQLHVSQLSSPVHPEILFFLQTVKSETSVHSCRCQELGIFSEGNSSHQTSMIWKVKRKINGHSNVQIYCHKQQMIGISSPHLWSWAPQTTACRCRHGCQTRLQPGRSRSDQRPETSPERETNTNQFQEKVQKRKLQKVECCSAEMSFHLVTGSWWRGQRFF